MMPAKRRKRNSCTGHIDTLPMVVSRTRPFSMISHRKRWHPHSASLEDFDLVSQSGPSRAISRFNLTMTQPGRHARALASVAFALRFDR